MYTLYEAQTHDRIGTVTKDQIRVLVDFLEEESSADKEYYIDGETLSYMEENEADGRLLEILKDALGDKDFIEVYYEAEGEPPEEKEAETEGHGQEEPGAEDLKPRKDPE